MLTYTWLRARCSDGAEDDWNIGWMERAHCYWAVAGVPVTDARIGGGCCSNGAPRTNEGSANPLECLLGAEAHMRRVGEALQRLGARGKAKARE